MSIRFRRIWDGGTPRDCLKFDEETLLACWKQNDSSLSSATIDASNALIWGNTDKEFYYAVAPVISGGNQDMPLCYLIAHYARKRLRHRIDGYGRAQWIALNASVGPELQEVERFLIELDQQVSFRMTEKVAPPYDAPIFPDPIAFEPLASLRCPPVLKKLN
jgi:hypothetical protein